MNKLTHVSAPSVDGELAISTGSNELTTKIGALMSTFGSPLSVSIAEADAGYMGNADIPITQVGDLTYLPLDVKDDFKGAITPWNSMPYALMEQDGTAVMIRPGYDGAFTGLFYSFSTTGNPQSDSMRHTDAQYAPPFLGPNEYVSHLFTGSPTGFLVCIGNKSAPSTFRYFWIEHNGTLDARFHTYLDITTNFTAALPNGLSAAYMTGVYVPEANALVLASTNAHSIIGMVWFTVNRSFQSSYNATNAAALPTKSVNWSDLSGTLSGTNNAPILVSATTTTDFAKYFKVLNPPPYTLTNYIVSVASSGRRSLSYAVSSTGVVRFTMANTLYLTWRPASMARTWQCSFDYNPSTNVLSATPANADETRYQSLPYVIDYLDPNTVNDGPVPETITDDYKANKHPFIASGIYQTNFQNLILHVGDYVMLYQNGSSSGRVVNASVNPIGSYSGATDRDKAFSAFGYLVPQYTQIGATVQQFEPSSASVISEGLQYAAFTDSSTVGVSAVSRLIGDPAAVRRNASAYKPNGNITGTIYSIDQAAYLSAVTSHSSSDQTLYSKQLALTTFIEEDGPMIRHSMSTVGTLNTASFLQAFIDTNGVPTQTYSISSESAFRTRLSELANYVIGLSTPYNPANGARVESYALQVIDVITGSHAKCLFSVCYGAATESYHALALVNVPFVGNTIDLSQPFWTFTTSVTQGPSSTGDTVVGPRQAQGEQMGVFKASGEYYVLTTTPQYALRTGDTTTHVMCLRIVGNTIQAVSAVAAKRHRQYIGTGVHPTYGLYYTDSDIDAFTKSIMSFHDHISTSSQTTRILGGATKFMSATATDGSTVLVSSKAAQGFSLYSSSFPVYMNGRYGDVPQHRFDLNTIVADPSNKTFLMYVEWTGSTFELKGYLTAQEETRDRTFIGTVITDANRVTVSAIKKVTRFDTYRIDPKSPVEGSAIRTYRVLADIQGYIFDTSAEATAFRGSNVPPSQATVFNTWDRSSGMSLYYPGGVGATGDAAAWTFQTNPDRIVQPNNTASYESFISPDMYSDYEMEATLYSSDIDDDIIGLVAAGIRLNGTTNLQLMLLHSANGLAHPTTGAAATSWNHGFHLLGATPADTAPFTPKQVGAIRTGGGLDGGGNGWNGGYVRVRVVRRGNVITATCSDWQVSRAAANSASLLASSELVLDMATVPELAPLLTSARYGYTTVSQAGATYYDVAFSGGLDKTKVVDLQTGQVWKYNFTTAAWELSANTIQQELGYVREITNPETGETYVITEDGVYKL